MAERDTFEERAALIEAGAKCPREWAEGFARLDRAAPPPGFSAQRWREVMDAGGRFLDAWGEQAAALGWRAEDVFGAHPTAPAARYDAAGLALFVGDGAVEAITADSATIRRRDGARLTYRRSSCSGSVCVWELQRSAAA